MKVLKNPKHIICIAVTIAFILISGLVFGKSWLRLFEALRDVGLSFINAFGAELPHTVNKMPGVELGDLGILPENVDVYAIKMKLYGRLIVTGTSFTLYGYYLARVLVVLTYVLLCLIPFAVAFIGITLGLLLSTNNDYGKDTKPLKIVKKISEYTYCPAKRGVKSFVGFIRERKAYPLIWAVVWCFSFNFPTILFEALAYYFYFIATFDIANLYVQACKLVADLSIIINFFPLWCWVIIGLIIYDIWRRHHAFKKLDSLEEDSEDFCKEMSVSNMIVAPMNMKKTTLLSDLAITFNKVFR